VSLTPPTTWDARPIHISGYDRQALDYYPTPDWVTQTLVRHVPLRGPVWEPCCGDGAISRVLERNGHEVVPTDLSDHGYGQGGVDFYQQMQFPPGCRAMVTNPPYGDGGVWNHKRNSPNALPNFVRHALELTQRANGQLALLVRLQWIAGARASAIISSGPLSRMVVLTKRILWFDNGPQTTNGQHNHAWLFWDCAHDGSAAPGLVFARENAT
jgi:hypothetical protein